MHQQRFDQVAHALLNEKIHGGVSKSQVRKLIMVGAAYLNGKRCRIASKPVFKGSEVRVEYNPEKLRPIQLEFPSLTPKDILFNEGGLIVVNKPANMPTVATLDNARDNLVAALKTLLGKDHYLGKREDQPPAERLPSTSVYIGIHHRLDAPTSGCILFTLDESTYGRELAPLAGHYPALRLGPPWWFFDSVNGMRRYFDRVVETAGLYNTAGFNDDTRAFASIPARHDVWRRVSCDWLAGMVVQGLLEEDDAQEMAADCAYTLAKRAYRFETHSE